MTSLIMISTNGDYQPVEKEIPVYTISVNSEQEDESDTDEKTNDRENETISETYCEENEEEYEETYEAEYEEESEEEAVEAYYGSDLFGGIDTSFKAYMDYRCITDTGSVQYDMQLEAYTDERGFRRIGDDYCVALGTGITGGCGERFLITLDTGSSFTVIVSDIKSDEDTDISCCYVPRYDGSGNVVEFIIDSDIAEDGMLSSGNAGYYSDLDGCIAGIEQI